MRISLCLLFLIVAAISRADSFRLWPHRPPGETAVINSETNISQPGKDLVAGKPVIRLANVSNPIITVFPASKDRRTGAAVVVCPGGGYHILAWDLEGTEICQWLNACGVTGILLKYRVPAYTNQEPYLAPLQDAQRALSLARQNAHDWNIKPDRIGILGFSAGGHLSAVASCRFDSRAYSPVDGADQFSCRPDFAVIIYPGYLADRKHDNALAPELTVTSNTPPTFLVQTEDDPVGVENSLVYYTALKNAHVPAEMHLFPVGGHGYGMRSSTNDVHAWPRLAETWMRQLGMLRR